jgi:hypothetical protein
MGMWNFALMNPAFLEAAGEKAKVEKEVKDQGSDVSRSGLNASAKAFYPAFPEKSEGDKAAEKGLNAAAKAFVPPQLNAKARPFSPINIDQLTALAAEAQRIATTDAAGRARVAAFQASLTSLATSLAAQAQAQAVATKFEPKVPMTRGPPAPAFANPAPAQQKAPFYPPQSQVPKDTQGEEEGRSLLRALKAGSAPTSQYVIPDRQPPSTPDGRALLQALQGGHSHWLQTMLHAEETELDGRALLDLIQEGNHTKEYTDDDRTRHFRGRTLLKQMHQKTGKPVNKEKIHFANLLKSAGVAV